MKTSLLLTLRHKRFGLIQQLLPFSQADSPAINQLSYLRQIISIGKQIDFLLLPEPAGSPATILGSYQPLGMSYVINSDMVPELLIVVATSTLNRPTTPVTPAVSGGRIAVF